MLLITDIFPMEGRVFRYCVLRSTCDNMYTVVKVTRKYQITIPREIREKLGIRIGDLLKVRVEDGKVVLEPMLPRRRNPIDDMLSLISEPINIDAVKLVEESWNED